MARLSLYCLFTVVLAMTMATAVRAEDDPCWAAPRELPPTLPAHLLAILTTRRAHAARPRRAFAPGARHLRRLDSQYQSLTAALLDA
uniref:Uncharacterized protein n=1 Tax=Mycena chlorophos TaxID=658473 RepID=A0ABQ0LDZ3_MYCCL|nr:predicted protein [Mycena chlorophos]